MDHEAFAQFVRRAVDDAKNRRGWTVTRLATETGVGRSTLFRWLAGDCQDFPELANVRSFCAALDIPVGVAFAALGVREETEIEARMRVWLQERPGAEHGDGPGKVISWPRRPR